jgi:hypothetical protein
MRRTAQPLVWLAFTCALTLGLAACESDPTATPAPNDAADGLVDDTGADAVTDDDTATDTATDATQTEPGDYGFTYRVPQQHTVVCKNPVFPSDPQKLWDTDWLCTFAYGAESGFVYVQGTPVDCNPYNTELPVLAAQAWFSDGTKVTKLASVEYDWGGNHHNDMAVFEWKGLSYKTYHSSFGSGWRSCQPMDCLVVSQPGGALVEDGCTAERTLPIVCVPIGADGGHAALVDTFAKCDGDPN